MMDRRRQRIWEAQRAGLLARLRDAWHLPEQRAASLLGAWSDEAQRRGIEPLAQEYWSEAEPWIRAQVEPRELPGSPPSDRR